MPSKIITQSSVKIDKISGLVRVDGIIVCKKVILDGRTYLQFKDKDRPRGRCRGTTVVEIRLSDFYSAISAQQLVDNVDVLAWTKTV